MRDAQELQFVAPFHDASSAAGTRISRRVSVVLLKTLTAADAASEGTEENLVKSKVTFVNFGQD